MSPINYAFRKLLVLFVASIDPLTHLLSSDLSSPVQRTGVWIQCLMTIYVG